MLSSSVTLYVIITYFPHYQKGYTPFRAQPISQHFICFSFFCVRSSSPEAFSEIILMNPFPLLQNILLSSSLPYQTTGILQSGSGSPSVR